MNALSVLTISQLNMYVKSLLDGDSSLNRVFVSGEISNFTNHYRSGHLYLSLKDEKCVIKAVMFSSYASRLRFEPKDGMKVLVRGRVSLYEQSGQYQLYIEDMQPDGLGALNLAYEQLKEKLAAEGLFDTNKKQPLPEFPNKVGVITSPTGAVIHDIQQIMARRYPLAELVLCPVKVQGEGAAKQVVQAIELFNRKKAVDVLIVGRGGGSMEDLWAFNEEMVARAIFDSKIPIISAVGHETDFTIADFIADMRAPTPSAAAEIAVPENEGMSLAVMNNYRRLNYLMDSILSSSKNTLQTLSTKHCFTGFADNIYDNELYVSQLQNRLLNKMQSKIELASQNLKHRIDNLENISPLKILQKGYSLTYDDSQKLIRSAKNINVGDKINVVFNDGNITATVEEVRNNNGYKENL